MLSELNKIPELINNYQLLDDRIKTIIHYLALCSQSEDLSKLQNLTTPRMTQAELKPLLEQCVEMKLINRDSASYLRNYSINNFLRVWLYPLLKDFPFVPGKAKPVYSYYHYRNVFERLTDYLDFLCDRRSFTQKEIDYLEPRLVASSNQANYLLAALYQPAYDELYPKISSNIINILHGAFSKAIFDDLEDIDNFQLFNEKFRYENSPDLRCKQAEIAFKQGDFDKVFETVSDMETAVFCFATATKSFLNNNTDEALEYFEKGMKIQRRDYKNSYVPLLPEAALCYMVAWMSKEQEAYTPVFNRIVDVKTKFFNDVHFIFCKISKYVVYDLYRAEGIVSSLQTKRTNDKEEVKLWNIIALGLIGKKPAQEAFIDDAEIILQKSFTSGYLSAAYEAAYTLLQWRETPDVRQIYDTLLQKFAYPPILSHIKHLEEWEKQLNSYLKLEAVQSITTPKNKEEAKMRVAYRFFPKLNSAQPILQTRQPNGTWTAGRNIAMTNFINKKVDCMSPQDKRIAEIRPGSYYAYMLGREAIVEMVGHPYIFFEHSDIPVELVAAQPTLSVVGSPKKGYKIESDVTDVRSNILIEKETNTRYRVYEINKHQKEIIQAVTASHEVPERGREKLVEVLKYFGTFINIQSDLPVGETKHAKRVKTDSRIRVQLLPWGDGIKAELFVKPFGDHPPYCKPGRGGKVLISNENGERLQVTRNLSDESEYGKILLDEIQSIENISTTDDLMAFDNPLDALELLDILQRNQDIAVAEWPEGERFKIRKVVDFNNLKMKISSSIDWFEVDGELKVDEDTVLSIKELLEMIQHGHGRFLELSDGEFLALSERFRQRLTELSVYCSRSANGVTVNRFASASIIDTFDDFESVTVDKAWSDFRKRLQSAQESDTAVSPLLQAELRPYQITGFRWMIRLSEWGAGACLADDMGLGKTVQAIAVLLHRSSEGPAMVVSPVSVTTNWISEVKKFAPSLSIKTLSAGDRSDTLASLTAGDLLITSYGLLLSEEKSLVAKRWATIILDEAHAIKNYNTKTSKAAMSLQADFRLILTGTPLQNHLGEMWNLFQFINPGLLGSLTHFTDTFIKSDSDNARKRLKKLITPFILRRTKTAVLEELPPKTEIIKKIELSNEEMAFYEALRRRAVEMLANDDSAQGAKHLKALAEITRLRQACCNPLLVEPNISIASTKLSAFLEIVSELKDSGHRALVFSQFVTHLAIVRKSLDKAGFLYQYLDGSTPSIKREAAVRNFQSGQGDLFLISLKAGGLGLNLTAADYVIHLDPWWNPAIEDQASDRAYRIGQDRPVTVYRLVAQNTIEEKIIRLHNTKRELAQSLLEGSDQSAKLSISELMELIKEA
ncbi:MAG: DEAD/DEAH box helicase [Bacteroidales bacterium]|jgi:SNF2 family DNA or RNA helicase|nr:DEAD/DEAH box helicase [Bacteroidales bacterium]